MCRNWGVHTSQQTLLCCSDSELPTPCTRIAHRQFFFSLQYDCFI